MPKCPNCGHEFTNKNEPIPDGFEEFWRYYPRRLAKGQAIRAYKAALGKTTKEILLIQVKKFAELALTKDKEFVAYPATWLNGQRWLDDDSGSRRGEINDHVSQSHPTDTPQSNGEDIAKSAHESWGPRAELLVKLIGVKNFQVWFKDVTVSYAPLGGTILYAPSFLQRDWIEQKFAGAVFSVFGPFEVVYRRTG